MEAATATHTHIFEARDLQVRAEGIVVVDKERRVIEMTLATDTPVITFDYRNWRYVKQILTMSAEAMDATRLNGGIVSFNEFHPSLVPIHEGNQIGVFESVRFEAGKMIATARISTRPDDKKLDGLWHDIKDGIRAGVSIGFKPLQVTIEEPMEGSGDMAVMYVNSWEFMEGSLADVPADPSSGIGRRETPAAGTVPTRPVEVRSLNSQVTAAPTAEPENNPEMQDKEEIKPPVEDVAAIEARAAAAVWARVEEIEGICRDFRVSEEQRSEYLKSKATPDEVRKLVQRDWAKNDPNKGANGGLSAGANRADDFFRAVEDGLVLRTGGTMAADVKPQHKTDAEQFSRMTFMQLAERVLQQKGVDTRMMTSTDIARAALVTDSPVQVRAGIVPADLPQLLGNTINRTLARQFELRQPTWRPFCVEGRMNDFRPKRVVKFGDASPLRRIPVNGNIEYGSLTDSGESYSLDHYGRAIRIDWRAIVNDDMSAFTRLPGMFAAQVQQLHSDLVYAVLLDNDDLEDGEALFSTAHGNIAATGTALDDTNLAAAKKAMMVQKSIGDGTSAGSYMNLMPRYLVVGPELSNQAKKLINSTIVPNTVNDVNTHAGTLQVIEDARIEDKAWFLFADPTMIETIEFAYLQGLPFRTEMDTRNFDSGSYAWKVESSFGVKAIEHRGMYYNAGV